MFTTSKVALSLALVLATVSAVLAGPKQAVRQQTTVQPQVLAGSHLSLDSVRSAISAPSTAPANQPSNISPHAFERLAHLIEDFEDIGLKEDLGN